MNIGKLLPAISLLAILALTSICADTSEAKTQVRKDLLSDRTNPETRIRLGIIIADDVADSGNMNFAAEAESALRLLDDEVIADLDSAALTDKAAIAKAAVYRRLFMPETAAAYAAAADGRTAVNFGRDIEMPYYIDLGVKIENPYAVLLPYAGIGLIKSAFSSMLGVKAGVKYFRKGIGLDLQWVQAAIPDFSCFDYSFAESYALGGAAFSFAGNVLRVEAAAGRMLYARETDNYFSLKQLAFTDFGIKEKLNLELMLFNDGLNKFSGKISSGMQQIPSIGHNSWFFEAAAPISFDFVYFEFGFIPRIFHTAEFPGCGGTAAPVNIGRRHWAYENAIMLGKDSASLNYRYYETTAAVDGVFRLFTFPFRAPADRIYLAVNGSAGMGRDDYTGKTDTLYALGFSAGFDLHDNVPFELRFGVDQDGYKYVYMTVKNRISHSY